ncbi:MAG: LacI family DNA-binding transcriptional regulator [Cyclobacteriaceae bacterium]
MKPVATIKDIARELGISPSTVSRILNGLHQGNKVLAEQVKETAKRLNYQVNTAAKGLRTSKTRLIGLIVPDISDDFFASILSGIEKKTEFHGYNLMICQSNESDEKEVELIKSLLACNVEGILISPARGTKSLENLQIIKQAGKEAVVFDRPIEQEIFPSVNFADEEATYMAAKHLISQGHRRFLYLGMTLNLVNDKHRLEGYNKALKEAGLSGCDCLYVDQMHFTEQKLKDNWTTGQYDVVVCFNDIIAIRALSYFNDNDISVPQEVSLLGFDNRLVCDFTNPKLSSVEHSPRKMGEMAALKLLEIIDNAEPEPLENKPELVLRNTIRKIE